MILVANKADLENERVVSYQEGEDLAAQMKVCSLPSFHACHLALFFFLHENVCTALSNVFLFTLSRIMACVICFVISLLYATSIL